ncbi:hypothetical protein AB0I22_03985 [Streptomyces sp. NPDC050610]|uniref:hypothetical protein n=1 Tax=Streptomyces sp. NPDC050610 TaxID=3157097 RepID=UPI003443B510
MSDDKEETAKNAPLPRMSRESAQTWARKFTERLAKSIGEPVGPRTPDARFLKCGGKNGETATDDRFILMYSAWVKVPAERHNEAAHKLREILVDEGYTITTERSYKAPKQSMILEARPKKGGFFIAIQSAAVDGGFPEITLGIDSPCMIPPGATQSHQ